MSVIFNSVSQFVEQVGRRRTHRSNPTQLDTMDCVFIGPSVLATGFVPLNLAIHPEFPGMQCSGWEITDKEALAAEVRASYTGKLNGGSGLQTTAPVITTSRHLGAISFSSSNSISATQIATTGWAFRYTAKGVTFKYLTNLRPAPGFVGNFADQAEPYLGYENLQSFRTSLSYSAGAPSTGYTQATLSWHNDLTDLPVNDLGNGWFDCAEVYMTQVYVNSQVMGVPGQNFTVTTVLGFPT